jgi:hypothetical protein
MGREIGCMISEGPWLFVGIPDAVKVGRLDLRFVTLLQHYWCNGVHVCVYLPDLLVLGIGLEYANTSGNEPYWANGASLCTRCWK